MNDCIFCKIATGDIPAKIVSQTDRSVAFWDISPRQPVHILVVPKRHFANVAELALEDAESLVDLMQLGAKIASEYSSGSFRLTFNTGVEAGQTVFHAHGHITSRTPRSNNAG